MFSDLRFAVRQLAKSPGFLVVAVLTLALGIGANTAIFSVVDALLLKSLPYPESDRLVQIWEAPNTGGRAITSGGVFMDWQDHTTQLESIAAAHQANKNLTGGAAPVRVGGLEVSADYLRVLRVNPILGRGFSSAEDAPGGDRHVAVLSYELWQTRFQGNPAMVGQPIHLDGESYTVIGVLPPNALLAPNVSFLTPATIRAEAWKQSRDYNYVCAVIGRLKPGATLDQAAAELTAAKQALNASYPKFKVPWTVTLQTLHEATFGGARPYVLTLLAAVGFVLLIACANVANLLLAKASSRQGEIAVRLALGATTGRIIRQLLTESMLLALAGGAAGVSLGWLASDWLIKFTGVQAAPGVAIGIDDRVLLFALLTTCATGLLFGTFPALSAAHPDLQRHLKEGVRGSTGGARHRLQSLLIVSETALTVVLLVSAGLLLRSFVKSLNADTGFKSESVLVFDLSQPNTKAPTVGHRVRFVREILQRIAQVPGVASVGMASSTPMNGNAYFGDLVTREDQPDTRNDSRFNAGFDSVAGDFFQTLGIPLLRGRFFTEADNDEAAPKVMIVNDVLARRLFGDEDPLGRLIHFKDATWEIVGVVGSVRRFALGFDPTPQVYYAQVYFPWYTTIVVRTRVPPLTLAPDVRRAVQSVDPEQPIANLGTLEQAVGNSVQTSRIVLTLVGLFAATALVLACIGIYGVMAYSVAQRTREMGIRIALGAGSGQVVALVLRHGMTLVLVGVAIGALGSLGAGQLLSSQLYRVTGTDPLVFTLVAIALIVVALLACWLPARRATRVDPVTALRTE
ncbi:MAG TPA: ABC transporter permease [Opitutaceae bacterium]|nr:ABC transporter permease [Opitutaceae bacterium]